MKQKQRRTCFWGIDVLGVSTIVTESSVGRMLTCPELTLAAIIAAITEPAVPADTYQAVELEAPGFTILRLDI